MSDGNGGADPGPEVEEAFVRGLSEAARRHWNPPPETPREEIWAGIREARAGRDPVRDGRGSNGDPGRGRGFRQALRPKPWWIGIAAALALGVALGRISERPATGPEGSIVADAGGVATAVPDSGRESAAESLPYRAAAGQLLDRSETFLTMVRAGGAAEESVVEVREWARPLLTRTRLLLGSPAADDPQLRALLDDLEIVLTQIAQLREGDSEELEWIDEGMDQRRLLFRLRAATAAGGTGTVRM
ncbi:MAG: hypothetical protein R6X22_13810 [Gemmatimonadota bacterium]